MKRIILALAVFFSMNIILTSCKGEAKEDKKEQIKAASEVAVKDVYQCPMKCEKEKTYDKEGVCPVCEMKLKKKVAKK